jgi:hypothetical protein
MDGDRWIEMNGWIDVDGRIEWMEMYVLLPPERCLDRAA